MSIKATIIVLAFNNFKYIYEAIDSILIQDYDNIELIVADDCSKEFPKDDILKYINDNKRNNIINVDVYSNIINLGTVKNLNTAIKKASGKYIINLASDDVFYNEKVVSAIVEKLDNSSSGTITCRRLKCDKKLNPIRYMPTKWHIKEIEKLDTNYKQHSAFISGEHFELASGSSTYYLREALHNDGLYNEDYRLLEDRTHFLEITRNKKIEYCYDIISIEYREGGISSQMSPQIKKDYLKMLENEKKYNYQNLLNKDKRYLDYNYERISKNNNFLIKYIDIFIRRIIYIIKTKIYCYLGKREIKEK